MITAYGDAETKRKALENGAERHAFDFQQALREGRVAANPGDFRRNAPL